ncbi:MAG: tRNA 2-thiouridine(34) synthase MnmA [Muribaculaceae bacterium]|nr:tRNA 2-thiouridine(34) synthase MnmA [Muribaculaceae bacterium]
MNVAALISGGVDSAVAVHLLKEQGHDLTLFYIRIGMDNGEGDCSAEEDIEMCSLIAKRYGLPLEIVSLHQEYWDNVMEYALRTVKAGLTPNPDLMCNKMIKFGFFEQRWGKDFDITATGHYASTKMIDGKKWLATAVDPVKDQTDFLARISYDQLLHLTFPLGDIPKSKVRELAIDANLPNAYRKDSQGICFLGKINYNDFIRRHLGEKKGPIIEIETGRKIGEHKGFWFHTIGQRKGLGLSGGPWYVVKKNVHDNVIYVSQGYDTDKQFDSLIHIDEMHFITENPWISDCNEVDITFKNRHSPEFNKATLTQCKNGGYLINSENKIQGIAPGQYAVLYDPSSKICYGSGVITGQRVNF